jgi:Ca-activated chloride channel family protein
MTATDVEPSRADAAVAALKAFVNASPAGTAVGIVSFATGAQVILPPTRDRDQIANAVNDIPPPNGATAIGDALIAAQRVLPTSGHRVVVLITDGEANYGADPMASARQLAASHIPLYTIGIGTNSGALIPGTLQAAGIDEDALRAYASATGGAYSRADNATELRTALARLGRITAFERRSVDVSLPLAEAGAVLMVLAFLGGLAAGRYP